jgi:hypothetical protein
MKEILEEMQVCLNDMIDTMHERSSVHPSEGTPVTRHDSRESILYYLFTLDAAVAGGLRKLERTNNDKMLSKRDKANFRGQIQVRFDIEFDLFTSEIEFRPGQPEWWATPVEPESPGVPCPWPGPGGRQHMAETMVQWLLIQRTLFPLNERLREYIWGKGNC